MAIKSSNIHLVRQHHQAIGKLKAKLKASQDELILEKEQVANLAIKLKCTQNRFYLVNSLVDAQLLEEEWELTN